MSVRGPGLNSLLQALVSHYSGKPLRGNKNKKIKVKKKYVCVTKMAMLKLGIYSYLEPREDLVKLIMCSDVHWTFGGHMEE